MIHQKEEVNDWVSSAASGDCEGMLVLCRD